METLPPYKRAVIDWILAHGSPVSTFGPGGRQHASEVREHLARVGVDYDASILGDLGGQTWSENTYDEATAHPGLWAQVVPVGVTPDRWGHYDEYAAHVWFVDGERLALSDVITGVIEAGQVGDALWRTIPDARTEHPY